jgi:hypothetical protein
VGDALPGGDGDVEWVWDLPRWVRFQNERAEPEREREEEGWFGPVRGGVWQVDAGLVEPGSCSLGWGFY